MLSIVDKIKRRIYAKKRGWVFTPKDFIDLGTRAAVDQNLARLTKNGIIRRLDRGVYDYPLVHDKLGKLSPDVDKVAVAVSAKTNDDVFASGASAANFLGLSTQVPARPTYSTSGASKTVKVAGRTISFRHTRVPILKGASAKANSTLQGLAYLGKGNIDDAIIARCAGQLDDRDMRVLVNNKAATPGWLADVITKIDRVKHGSVRA
jgi:hypothetical protein